MSTPLLIDQQLIAIVGALKNQNAFFAMLSALYYAPMNNEHVKAFAGFDFSYYINSAIFEKECESGGQLASDRAIRHGLFMMQHYFKRRHSAMRLELNVDFTGAFYGVKEYQGKVAAPYESVFCDEAGLLNQKPRQQVFNAYKRHGLKLVDRFNTPEDHLSFELQFLGFLAKQAAAAVQSDNLPLALALAREESAFLQEHLLNWFPALRQQAEAVLETDFYRGLLLVTDGYLSLVAMTLADIDATLGIL